MACKCDPVIRGYHETEGMLRERRRIRRAIAPALKLIVEYSATAHFTDPLARAIEIIDRSTRAPKRGRK